MIKNETTTLLFGGKKVEVPVEQLNKACSDMRDHISKAFDAEFEDCDVGGSIPMDYETRMMWVIIKAGVMSDVLVAYMLRAGCDPQRLKDTFAVVIDREHREFAAQALQVVMDNIVNTFKKSGKQP